MRKDSGRETNKFFDYTEEKKELPACAVFADARAVQNRINTEIVLDVLDRAPKK